MNLKPMSYRQLVFAFLVAATGCLAEPSVTCKLTVSLNPSLTTTATNRSHWGAVRAFAVIPVNLPENRRRGPSEQQRAESRLHADISNELHSTALHASF